MHTLQRLMPFRLELILLKPAVRVGKWNGQPLQSRQSVSGRRRTRATDKPADPYVAHTEQSNKHRTRYGPRQRQSLTLDATRYQLASHTNIENPP